MLIKKDEEPFFYKFLSIAKEIMYGASYTSRIILNSSGFGYAVCEECYYKNDMKDVVKKG